MTVNSELLCSRWLLIEFWYWRPHSWTFGKRGVESSLKNGWIGSISSLSGLPCMSCMIWSSKNPNQTYQVITNVLYGTDDIYGRHWRTILKEINISDAVREINFIISDSWSTTAMISSFILLAWRSSSLKCRSELQKHWVVYHLWEIRIHFTIWRFRYFTSTRNA